MKTLCQINKREIRSGFQCFWLGLIYKIWGNIKHIYGWILRQDLKCSASLCAIIRKSKETSQKISGRYFRTFTSLFHLWVYNFQRCLRVSDSSLQLYTSINNTAGGTGELQKNRSLRENRTRCWNEVTSGFSSIKKCPSFVHNDLEWTRNCILQKEII